MAETMSTKELTRPMQMRPRSTRRSSACWSSAAGSTVRARPGAARPRASHDPLHLLLPKLGLVSEREVAEALAQLLDLPLASEADYPDLPLPGDRISAIS